MLSVVHATGPKCVNICKEIFPSVAYFCNVNLLFLYMQVVGDYCFSCSVTIVKLLIRELLE